jgi:hypothetical protein
METNETAKKGQYQEAEEDLMKLIEELEEIEEGKLHELEQKSYERCLGIARKLMQCRMNRGNEVEKAPSKIIGKCGHDLRLVGYRKKQILTVVGKVDFKRAYYQCESCQRAREEGKQEERQDRCAHGTAPADEIWGVDQRRTTPGVQKMISYFCARLTFEEAAETFADLLPLAMSARQAQVLMKPVGKALAQREDEEVKELFKQAEHKYSCEKEKEDLLKAKTLDRLYIELDGVLARMRRGSVEMEKDEQNRKGDIYREIKVGAVFLAERGRERSELAPQVWIDTPKKGSMRYVARRSAQGGFGQLLASLAYQAGLPQAKQVVVLGDGAPWIWKLAEEHFPGAVHIVDLYHAKQHVWEVAHAVFGQSSPQACAWASMACDWLVHGQIEDLIAALAELPAMAPPSGQSKSLPEQAIGYFTTNAERMRYPAFRAQGMHVGSGIAEAACKTVVATRLKRSGMRWTPDGLDAILPLRTSVLNHCYEDLWKDRSRLIA